MKYPVLDVIPQLKAALNNHHVVILQAPPGAGKSTVLPLELVEETWLSGKKIIMLEPRRLAAKTVAERMSSIRNEKIGQTIGYRIRFDTCVSAHTRIEVVTEGILTRMIQSDNSLADTALLIFDEFHERSLHGDLALALSLQMQHVLRDDLRILIMSATLDGEQLSSVMGGVPVITTEGKEFPVKIIYSPQVSDTPLPMLMAQAVRKAMREQEGDILAFLPGAGEIRRVQQLLEEDGVDASVHPLFGDLPFRQQQDALLPRSDGKRKIVLATSIAETSLTIEGIHIVIDGGLSRVPRFDPRSGLTRLETIRVTQDSADQRAGRAGRLGPGICYRLWTEAMHRNLVPQRKPEILEADLASLWLELAQWGIKDVNELTWVTPPPNGAVNQAKELLTQLDALDDKGITPRGKEMLRLPTHPRIAHLLSLADRSQSRGNEQALATDVAALLEERDPLEREAGADLTLRLEVLRKWRSGEHVLADRNILERIDRLAANWRRIFKILPVNFPPSNYEAGKLVMAAYPERIARQQGKQSDYYTLANGRVAKLPNHDPLMHEPWLCVAQLDAGQREGKIFMAAPVSEDDLLSLATVTEKVYWDNERGMVAGALEKRLGSLLLESRPVQKVNVSEKNKVWVEVIREKGLKILGWEDDCVSQQARIQSIKLWRPEEEWPDVSDNYLLANLEVWLSPYLATIYKQSELEKLDSIAMLNELLSWNQKDRIELLAPLKMSVPSGSRISIQYFADGRPPVMEVRLQEMFGLLETPTVNQGRTKILLHVLSPGYKPIQITQDLRSFWHTTYHEVRKELRRRYPKHAWPEDPWTAKAVRGPHPRPPSS